MELLRADQVESEPGERVFRHGRLGPICLLVALLAPLALGALAHRELLELAAVLPWFAWLVLAPIVLVVKLLYGLVVYSAAQVVRRSFLPTNWCLCASPAGLVLNLRSFQNTHFPGDGPTVARVAWREVALAREARDVTRPAHVDQLRGASRWLQLELAGVDTGPLAELVRLERERRGPQVRRFGVTSRTRFGHVPVFVAAPGVLRVDWLGRAVLRALATYVKLGERLEFDLAHVPDLDARLGELLRRGDRMAAIELARLQLGVTLTEAKELVESLGKTAA